MPIPFNASQGSSLGVEWEVALLDPQTRRLSGVASEILAEIGDADGEHPKVKHELFTSQLEIITGICGTVGEATADLSGSLAEVVGAAARQGARIACAGTMPSGSPEQQTVSPGDRYQGLIERTQWLARRLLIWGVHVHVGVRETAKVMPIVNALTGYIPHLLALSASSPWWQDQDTGLASARSTIFESMPTSGVPQTLADWDEFETFLDALTASGTVQSVKEVWWDVRPHPDFGTVELRICDGLPTLHEIGMVAAVGQCLVDRMDRMLDEGYTLPAYAPWLVRDNKWRASRWGLDTDIIVDDKGTTRPLRDSVADLLADLAPSAERLGCAEELSRVQGVLDHGAPYERLRAVAGGTKGDAASARMVDHLLAEMAAGRPLDAGGTALATLAGP